MPVRTSCLALPIAFAVTCAGAAQTRTPITPHTVTLSASAARHTAHGLLSSPLAAIFVATASMHLQLARADPTHRGELWLVVHASSDGPAPAHLTLRIPLSSTEDVFGESRSCANRPHGARDLVFTAGMDESSFVPFAASTQAQTIHLLLNKYLCRALAAPFRCAGQQVALPKDWSRWTLATRASLELSSAARSEVRASAVELQTTRTPFDPATCVRIAPSNGMCCVAGKSTAWHCGGTPAGEGWHQVSGECFHRETGGVCNDKTVFPFIP